MKVVAIVPAAGLARRMGGPNKLLLPWGDSTVIGTVVNTLLDCRQEEAPKSAGKMPALPAISDLIVVTGRDAQQVAEAAKPARSGFNLDFELGMGSSIAVGVRAAGLADVYLIALGDMPDLRQEVVLELIVAFDGDPNRIIVPLYGDDPDRPGHPVLFGRAYRQELMALTGDAGAKSIMDAHRDHLVQVPVAGSLRGIDEPGDLD